MTSIHKCIAIVVVAVCAAIAVMFATIDIPSELPKCQEDEVLFPIDYKGPGKNEPGDYRCIHIDNIDHHHGGEGQ